MSLNILVVDDCSVVRKIIIKTLRLAGIPIAEIYEAADGQQALEILDANWIDLAFIDINMPVMDGEEMIERVRANPNLADLPIVVISTEGSQTRIGHLEAMGATFIHKPFPPETVREVVTEMLGIRHEHQST